MAMSSDSVVRKIVAQGQLRLTSAAHFGGGARRDIDMALLRDASDESLAPRSPFIPGSTIAGCVRSYLATRMGRGGVPSERADEPEALKRLFGAEILQERSTKEEQSIICFDDVILAGASDVVRRDGVRIEQKTGTALEGAKYDFEVLEPGATGEIRLELTLCERHDPESDGLVTLFQAIMDGLASGDVRVGAKTTKGLGKIKVEDWTIWEYDFARREHALAWLANSEPAGGSSTRLVDPDKVDAAVPKLEASATLELDFKVATSVLVRSVVPEMPGQPGQNDQDVDFAQFKSGGSHLIPGTSIAGVIRARAHRIMLTAGLSKETAQEWMADIFGPTHDKRAGQRGDALRRSMVAIDEVPLTGLKDYEQGRIRINRFTGGVASGALFGEKAAWPNGQPVECHGTVRLDLARSRRDDAETRAMTGLLLLVAKDLWTGDLTVGGEAGVGRGVLAGVEGRLDALRRSWVFRADGEGDSRVRFVEGDEPSLDLEFMQPWRDWLDERKEEQETAEAS